MEKDMKVMKIRQIMSFVKFSCTESLSKTKTESLKVWKFERLKVCHRFHLLPNVAQRPHTLSAYAEMGEKGVAEGGSGSGGNGASLHQHPGPVGDVVSVKTLSMTAVAGLDESMSAKSRCLDEAPESMKHEDKKSPTLLPSACRRSNFQWILHCPGLHYDVTSCSSPEIVTINKSSLTSRWLLK